MEDNLTFSDIRSSDVKSSDLSHEDINRKTKKKVSGGIDYNYFFYRSVNLFEDNDMKPEQF